MVRLRDGRPAAVWRGLAFPVGPGDTIDVSAPGVAPSECLPADGSLAPAGPARRWAIIEGVEEAWVLIAGSVADRDAAETRLRRAGLEVLRSGPWLGEPVDGLDPDWFVRVVRPPTGRPLAALVEGSLGAHPSAAGPSDEAREDLRDRLVRAELDRARAEAAALREEVARLKEDASTAANLAERLAGLEADLARAREELTRQGHGSLPRAPDDASAPAPAPASPRLARRLQEEIATVLESLLPRVRLLRDSIVVASGEFRDRASFYHALRELAESAARPPPSWTKLRGTEGWWERHVSTGEDDAGRLYARALAGGGWEALLSHKGEQDRDIAWLRRLPR